MSKWTRESIIREMLRREAAGLPLVHTKKPGQGVDAALYAAGVRIFDLPHERWARHVASVEARLECFGALIA